MDKIRFGIIGTNFIVDTILHASKSESCFLVEALYSRNVDTAVAFAEKHSIPNIFTSLEEMAQSDLIDAVYIASPTVCHAEQSILFMKHGKHVLYEKPIASNAQEVRDMIEASILFNVTLMEAMRSTLTPNFKMLMQHIADIGVVRRYFASYCQYSSRYDKLKEGVVLNAFKPELSNGAVMDMGVYTIYPMIVLFGKPISIQASGMMLTTGVDGQGAVNFEYDGLNATVLYSKISTSFLPSEIQGEDGTLTMDQIDYISHLSYRNRKEDTVVDLSVKDELDQHYYEIAEFIDLIQSRKRESLINSHANSLATIEVVDEIRRQLGLVFPADQKTAF